MTGSDARRTALVTGASSGIGAELARVCAMHGHHLVLTARRDERLRALADELAARHGIETTVVAEDLGRADGPDRLVDGLAQHGCKIDILINNAGFGWLGRFADGDPDRDAAMIALNVATPVRLTRLLLPGMLERRWGRVLNVASTAAFQPGPRMANYYATKAYLLSFSEAIHHELLGSGVHVTALCPGPVATEFQQIADMKGARLLDLRMTRADAVARAGYAGVMRNRPIVVPGLMNRIGAASVRFTPRSVVRRLVAKLGEKSR